MEYLHGQDARTVVKRARTRGEVLPIGQAAAIVAGCAAGLHHAHDAVGDDGLPLGIVHRDVSPSNIVVTYDGGVKVVDFGVAFARSRLSETTSGTLKGKVMYMSPEQCRGRRLDRRSDVFSLGIVLYELLTGQRPFHSDEGEIAVLNSIIAGAFERPSRIRADLPRPFEDVIYRALADTPDERYATAGEMMGAIETAGVEAGVNLSAGALARFMQEAYGRPPEPWLLRAPSQGGLGDDLVLEHTISSVASVDPLATRSVGAEASTVAQPVWEKRRRAGRARGFLIGAGIATVLVAGVGLGVVVGGGSRAKPAPAPAAMPAPAPAVVPAPAPAVVPAPAPAAVPPAQVATEAAPSPAAVVVVAPAEDDDPPRPAPTRPAKRPTTRKKPPAASTPATSPTPAPAAKPSWTTNSPFPPSRKDAR
jgi:hypothetical protein